MSVPVAQLSQPAPLANTPPPAMTQRSSIVVVGNGPVGFRLLQEFVRFQQNETIEITVFGEESLPAYDRIHLTSFLDDSDDTSLEYEPREWYERHGIRLFTDDPVVEVCRQQKVVRSRSGRVSAYDHLVLATGSRPFMPPIEGIAQHGVFPYRTLDDLSRIRDYAAECKRAVVLGGGLLGLEAAHALTKLGVSVFVIEMASVLMPRQLDESGASLLKKLVESSRIRVLLQRQTDKISRIEEGLHVQFSSGESVVADMVVVSAGIRPRDELAKNCELSTGQRGGIIVNDQLLTSDPSISAIGECAEHQGTVYGLAAPGFQMAKTLADRLRGRDAAFGGSNEATRLKLVGINVVFTGDYLDTTRAEVLTFETSTSYTKLILRKNRLVGMVGVGDVLQLERLQEAIAQTRRINLWQRRRFAKSGQLWSGADTVNIQEWPSATVVCSCTGVTRGCLSIAKADGCATVKELAEATGASTVCGSCRPLIQQLAGEAVSAEVPTRGLRLIAIVSTFSLVLCALLSGMSPIDLPNSVQIPPTLWQTAITDTFWKKVTGFSIATAATFSLLVTLRKRTSILRKFSFHIFRSFHVIMAAAATLMLIAHTGFHRGSGLNFVLFTTFVLASVSGSIAGLLTGMEKRLPQRLRSLRRPLIFWHILCLWPLPVLIAFHIVSVYWL